MKLFILFSFLWGLIFINVGKEVNSLKSILNTPNADTLSVKRIPIGCLENKRFNEWFMIKSEEEYEKLLGYKSYYGNCPSYEFPVIDFSEFDLLCIKLKYGGCGLPNITINATEDRVNRRVKLDATLKNGFCRKLNVRWLYFLVSKPTYKSTYELFLNNRRM